MTNATTNVIARVAAALAGIGLVASALAPMAMAQTTTTTTTTTTTATFSRDLTIGSTGADVTALQNWLISKGHTIAAGATGYFGAQTKAALAAYQAANGISPAAGYFGPITRAKVMADGGSTTGGSTTGGSSSDLSGGEADLSDFDITREESEGAEGEEEVEVFTVEFDVEDGDVLVERMEIMASSTNSALEDRPWDFFDRVIIMVDGEEVADMDVDDRDAWDEEDGDGADIHRLTLTGLDIMVDEGDMAEITVAFDIAGNIDTADLAQEFDFYIPDDGIRAVDGEGIQQYIPGSDSDEITFGFEEEETGDLDIQSSSEDPDASTLVSDEDDESEDYTVFIFELENNEDVDVIVTDLTIDVATSSGDSIDSLLESATLVVDGDEFDGDINDDGTIDFEDVDFMVGGDETLDVELMVTLAEDADGTVDFSIDSADITAEADDSGEDTDVSGSASSETHTVGISGLDVEVTSTSSDVNDAGTIGTFRINFDVTAEGDEDIYIYDGAAQSDNDATPFTLAASTTGVAYTIFQGTSASTTDFAADSAILSGPTKSGNYFRVDSGETESFTLTVSIDPASGTATALYYIELDAIRFGDDTTSGTGDDSVYALPDESEYQTDAETIAAS